VSGAAPTARPSFDGILLVDKPTDMSSAHAVAIVKRRFGRIKVGHLGTLDPFAAGLLPLCLGEGTKLAPYLNVADKSYEGVVRLGLTTDTLDITGAVLATADPPDPEQLDLRALAASFVGRIEQVPPAYSAIKRQGVPMYKLARKGQAVTLDARPVTIYSLELRPAGPARLAITTACSKGTYVRSLARDIGEALGCGATLETLVRTSFGRFRLAEAVTLDQIGDRPERSQLGRAFVAPCDALAGLRRFEVRRALAAALRAGQQAGLLELGRPAGEGEKACVLEREGGLVAVLGEADGRWRLERVFGPLAPCAA